jgi:phosphatidylethanolamine-binding protein (PEBP) family uncharacterized protein
VNEQRSDLLAIVDVREAISSALRRFLTEEAIDRDAVMTLSGRYGELDGSIVHAYATRFAEVDASLTDAQRARLESLVEAIGYLAPERAFLYSEPVAMPSIENTDYLFGVAGAPTFLLSSPQVSPDGALPTDYTCDGARATLPLAWTGAPAETRSFALIMHHVAPGNEIKWYWILYDIPADVESLPRNVTGVGTLGANSISGRTEYEPPCSQGPGPKAYTYTVYALSAPVELTVSPSEVNREVLLAAMRDRTLASAELQVTYSRSTQEGSKFRRGDSNDDGTTDVSDALEILGFLFLGNTMNDCADAADVNDDGVVDISDPVRLLGYLFLGSEHPPDPFAACGGDSTGDELDCKTPDECS